MLGAALASPAVAVAILVQRRLSKERVEPAGLVAEPDPGPPAQA